ncbi:hypothetical protein E2542_SST09137 [Spatholobus suberectus]|nr:hypothetical protein E2542_SST09137 [Spatholobus suberectus]
MWNPPCKISLTTVKAVASAWYQHLHYPVIGEIKGGKTLFLPRRVGARERVSASATSDPPVNLRKAAKVRKQKGVYPSLHSVFSDGPAHHSGSVKMKGKGGGSFFGAQ